MWTVIFNLLKNLSFWGLVHPCIVQLRCWVTPWWRHSGRIKLNVLNLTEPQTWSLFAGLSTYFWPRSLFRLVLVTLNWTGCRSPVTRPSVPDVDRFVPFDETASCMQLMWETSVHRVVCRSCLHHPDLEGNTEHKTLKTHKKKTRPTLSPVCGDTPVPTRTVSVTCKRYLHAVFSPRSSPSNKLTTCARFLLTLYSREMWLFSLLCILSITGLWWFSLLYMCIWK